MIKVIFVDQNNKTCFRQRSQDYYLISSQEPFFVVLLAYYYLGPAITFEQRRVPHTPGLYCSAKARFTIYVRRLLVK